MKQRSWFLPTVLAFGFAFLYAPILLIMVYSFNENKSIAVFSRFSTKWYSKLLTNDALLQATINSLKIALMSATLGLIIGTLAAMIIVRFGRFRGRGFFSTMVAAPLVMPEVITGLSLLLLFVAVEQSLGMSIKGITTMTIAHSVFCLAYVAVVVQSRLVSFDTSVEEAALDLGAKPLKVFFVITLPLIAPALLSGWLLAFTLSMDDVIIATFVQGNGVNTLPIEVFSRAKRGVSPEVNALATIMISLVTICIVTATVITNRYRNKSS